MEDILLLKYPKLKDNILKARGAGKSDEDIETLIDRTIERKKLAGWTMDKVNARIGIDPVSLTRVSDAMRFNAMESISDAYKLSYGKAGELYDRAKELNLPISAVQEFPDLFKDRLHERETTDRNPMIAKFNALGEDKLSRMVGGITVGFMGAASGMFDGVDWLTGWEKAKQAADSLTNASKSLNSEIMQGREGNTFDALMQGLGSSGVFILPGVAVASMVGKAAKLGTFARTIASWTGAGVSAATESLAEAGGVYRQVMERTGDEMAASAAASSTFWLNMPTNFVSDKLAFFSDLPAFNKWLGSTIPERFVPVASQAIRGFVAEGAQETMQGAISGVYGEGKSWGDLNLSEIAFREGLPGGIVGALFGIGVGQDIRQAVTEQNASKVLRESATKVVEKAKEVLGKTGRPVEEIDSASALLGAYSMVASKRLGVTPEAWFEGKGLDVAEQEATEGLVLNQPAYHGSPHRFDKFTLDKIGTGEGAQAYGWGLYFAGDKKVADWYRQSLSARVEADHYLSWAESNKDLANEFELELGTYADRNLTASEIAAEFSNVFYRDAHNQPQIVPDDIAKGILHSKNALTKPGQLYEVEIPDNDMLLSWDKPLGEQGEDVKKILPEWLVKRAIANGGDGAALYRSLITALNEGDKNALAILKKEVKKGRVQLLDKRGGDTSGKRASQILNALGIKGIRYLDQMSRGEGEGTYNYVIFDDEAIQVLQTYYQDARGQIALSSGKAILKTFATADASTIVHEMGHLFLADTQQAFAEGKLTGRDAQDFRTLAKWLEAEEGQELTREQHEKFAQGFEQYLREGKAPSVKLKRVFERFRQWLTDIYANAEQLGAPLPDDIRDVFDRLLAFDSDIELARKLDAVQDEDAPEQTDYPTPEEEAEDEAEDLMDSALDGNIEAMASIIGNEDVKPTPKERAERLKRRAGEWVERQVARVAEGSRIGDFVEEWHALKELMASEKERGKGLKKGGGRLESRARVRAIRERLAGNDTRKTVRQMVKGIAKSTKGNISDRIRVEIRTLLDGFNLKRDDLRGLDALRAEFDAYMADNADADVRVEEETEALNARAVGEMTLAELADLAVQVKGLAKVGREEYKEWRLKEAEQQDKVRSKLMKPLENVKPDNAPVTTETTQKKEGTLKQIVASTLRPSRLFDWIDGRRDFKGPWYKALQEQSDKAWDAFLQWEDKREIWLEKAMEQHGINLQGLGEIRLRTKNEQGQAVNLNIEECMHIYASWGNWLNRQALRYGNGITQEVAEQAIGELTEEERAFADAIVREWEDNFERVNGALIEAYQVGMEKQKHYVPMFRMSRFGDGGMSGTDSMEALVEDIARLNSWRRLVANRGYAKAREILNPQFQSPIQMGLVSVWHRSVSLTEHTTAHARLVKDLQHVINEGGAPGVPSLLKRVEERHGRSTAEAIKNWVNTVASPGFYKGFTGLDNGVRKLRANSSIARIAWNLATIIKQPVAFMLYTADAGPMHMASAIAQLAANPHDLIKWVWEQDPQVKEQAIDRTLEELRKSGDAKYMKARRQLAKAGFAPVLWLDMITRVAGWKAVYDAETARGASPEEARLRAQRITLNTQNAAAPKELPMYMKHSEVVNLITQFTNQANQIFNVTFYDLPSDVIAKRGGHAIGTMSGLILSAMLMGILKNGRPPEDPAEVAEWVGEETLSSVPILGSSMSAVMSGFRYTGTSIDSIGAGMVNAVRELFDGDYEKAAYAAGEVIALTSGLPYQGAKRGWKAVYNGDWKELFGWAGRGGRKTSIPTW